MKDFTELPHPQRRAVDIVREVANEKGLRPYLVGGPVRDLLLGRDIADIDLTVEDDSSILARALSKRLNGRVRSFPQFLTYKVLAEGLPAIDIATARKERYRSRGALPTVTAGKLRDDLFRRDFSINAIALDLVRGALHDPTGGGEDLEGRRVRVLHDQSFLDDPTRIYRAIRLAVRLGFLIDDHSTRLIREAIEGGALGTISRERIWRELFLAMDEPEAAAILEQMATTGALDVLFGRRELQQEHLRSVTNVLGGADELDRYVLYTSVLLHGAATPADLEGSGFSQKRARNVMKIANELPRFSDVLGQAASDRQRFRVLRQASPEMLALLSSRLDRGGEIARFNDYQTFKLSLRGSDLEVPAGPHIARALERTREAVFTGEIPAEDARRFARQLAIQYLDHESAPER